jgi:hypothetical protein
MAALGFDHTILAGYSNNHMGYFATPREYGAFPSPMTCAPPHAPHTHVPTHHAMYNEDVGGYESQLTLWGRDTAEQIRAGCKTAAVQVVP